MCQGLFPLPLWGRGRGLFPPSWWGRVRVGGSVSPADAFPPTPALPHQEGAKKPTRGLAQPRSPKSRGAPVSPPAVSLQLLGSLP